jgi:hypothetical protein
MTMQKCLPKFVTLKKSQHLDNSHQDCFVPAYYACIRPTSFENNSGSMGKRN